MGGSPFRIVAPVVRGVEPAAAGWKEMAASNWQARTVRTKEEENKHDCREKKSMLERRKKESVRTQIWHKADQADATGQTGVPQWSDRWGVL
jgi:DNA replication protein DnaC